MAMKISLSNLTKVVWKNILVILIFVVLGGAAGGFYAHTKKHTTYNASRSLMVAHRYNNSTANEQVQADLSLTNTYKDMIESSDVAAAAQKELPKKLRKQYSTEDILSMIKVKTVMQSLVLTVSVEAGNAKEATQVVNAVVDAAKTELPKISPSTGTISTFAKAKVKDADSQTSPSTKKYLLAGVAVGVIVGMVLAFTVTTWRNLI